MSSRAIGAPQEGADMKNKAARLGTYTNWPVQFLEPSRMAASGFYYLGRGDEVRCAFCKVEITNWVRGDDPETDHKRWAPQCPFVRNNAHDTPHDRAPPARSAAAHPQYATEAARLRTFAEWPRGLKQRPEELAEAGFFYTGQGDKTRCFCCDGGLKDWEPDDAPWQQHARWYDRCEYVLLVKGRDFVQRVMTEACVVRDADNEPHIERPAVEAEVADDRLCKICLGAEKTVCFVPCGHVVACGKCAAGVTTCPVCRGQLDKAVRMYQV
ncbi:inhibitor of apoptosis protein 3 [Orgyia pseudotsugata multiple nucleopolyhedrovirus]|uniref:E3 ubiquitin-protein ligase IAP-3 n=1 Tax=Orgyia pseudotsugata multicapsid polyhedrosis virus TaxID=262177 RepID=IAP3_NPVOP|nr:inhibitor of apoptosis protein 3 [Orgyia pseudotsugata multiple nucleopolyhedrovirus]P41437.1 RecName: Full=E3 ubiquitin-protein ligase IAP-3; AltName: Full=IAP-3; AltName: Full=RING-type E3 ubiquitin transferase IAP-3 [Orgyia pseudotsugata multiple nucleopolyhedrovirus]pir/T10304/ inhibitor of apoptosis protein 3 - Orgyia pseudotsugata nuclear polyhedrosis virus [Orgyia pseudotsugata single capsid nuclopolyhedrovirus]AAB02610.1 iap [Orgyia pseudotsugata single capsid nuclopolyhedrovirus]AAC